MVFHSLLDYHSFWELFFVSLVVESQGSTIQNFLFTETESVIGWIKFPIIVSIFLFSWGVVSVSLSVHGGGHWVISDMCPSHWVYHLFSIFKSCWWNTISYIWVSLYLVRPVITSWVTFSERLSDVGCIFIFFNIVKFISKTGKSLSLDHIIDMSWPICAFSVTVALWEWFGIIGYSPMFLNFAGFIDVRFSVFLKMLWCRWHFFFIMNILSDTEVSVFSVTHTNNLESSLLDIRYWILSDPNTFLHCLSQDGCHFGIFI